MRFTLAAWIQSSHFLLLLSLVVWGWGNIFLSTLLNPKITVPCPFSLNWKRTLYSHLKIGVCTLLLKCEGPFIVLILTYPSHICLWYWILFSNWNFPSDIPELVWSSFYPSVNITFFLFLAFPYTSKKSKYSTKQCLYFFNFLFRLSLVMLNSQFLVWTQRNPILKGSRSLFPHQLLSSEICLCLMSKSHKETIEYPMESGNRQAHFLFRHKFYSYLACQTIQNLQPIEKNCVPFQAIWEVRISIKRSHKQVWFTGSCYLYTWQLLAGRGWLFCPACLFFIQELNSIIDFTMLTKFLVLRIKYIGLRQKVIGRAERRVLFRICHLVPWQEENCRKGIYQMFVF